MQGNTRTSAASLIKATVLLIPDHRLLDIHGEPYDWDFSKINEELSFLYTDKDPHDVHLYLVLTDITMREVDFPSLLDFLKVLALRYDLNTKIVMHRQPKPSPNKQPPAPHMSVLHTNGHKSQARHLSVYLATQEALAFRHWNWYDMLDALGFTVKAPSQGDARGHLVPLLESGFRHASNAQHMRMLTRNGRQLEFRRLPASGRNK